jgi:uncharacterized protein YndB with AHSA1/START domain
MLTKEDLAITVERDVAAAPGEAYRAFTNKAALQFWLCNSADVEARKGGRIYLWWDKGYYSSGIYTELERDKMVAFTWRGPGDPEATEVRVSIAPHGENGTHITLTHSGLGPGEEWAEAAFQDRRGWESAFDNLQSALEKGEDLRISRRPMFGLNGFTDLNDELIARLGPHVTEGLWISGFLDGMGAQKAGLQPDDILVSLGGHPITGFATFGNAIQNYRAGDNVEVGYYRGGEHHTVTVQLSQRPVPNIPATHDALVEELRAAYATVDAELDAALAGVTEQEADYRTGPDQWNVKEILAHLITAEQGTQSMIYSAIDDTDTNAPFFSNEPRRIRAVASAYGTLAACIEQLKRAEAITVAQVASMPASVQAHKYFYNTIAGGVTAIRDHSRAHIAEMVESVKAARSQA